MNNPYLEEFNELPRSFLGQYLRRDTLVKRYSWAIPGGSALEKIASYSPIVEMGAGSGYWAYLLRGLGVDVVAYDKGDAWHPDLKGKNPPRWTKVLEGTPESLRNHSDRTLLLVWPPYAEPMAYECLIHYGGNRIIYVGEGSGGCTADDQFHERLEDRWERVEGVSVPQWDGIHDHMEVWERK